MRQLPEESPCASTCSSIRILNARKCERAIVKNAVRGERGKCSREIVKAYKKCRAAAAGAKHTLHGWPSRSVCRSFINAVVQFGRGARGGIKHTRLEWIAKPQSACRNAEREMI